MTPVPHGKSVGRQVVIFGCGYIGSAVAAAALRRGMKVTALTRNRGAAAELQATGVATVVADLSEECWHGSVPAAPDFVLDCVAAGGGGAAGYHQSYYAGMESILRWTRTHGPVGTFVYTSSTSVYPQDGGVVVAETALPVRGGAPVGSSAEAMPPPAAVADDAGPDARRRILIETERLVAQAGPAWRRWFVLRLAGIYGPGRHHLLEQVRAGTVAGTAAHHLNLAHRDDIVAAILACFEAPDAVRNEVFNVADDGAAPKHEIVAWLAGRLRVPVPEFTGAPATGRRGITPDRIITNARLKAALGWQPRFATFREGYADIIAAASPSG